MKKLTALAALALLATTGTAHANEFAGFRAELHTGLDVAGSKYTYDDSDTGEDDDSETERYNKTGLLYGLGVGYDAAISPVITAGIEANLDFSNAKNKDFYLEYYDEQAEGWVYGDELKASREIEIAARFGYTVTPTTLLYVKGGYVNGRYTVRGELETDDGDDGYDYTPFKESDNRDGYRIGAGAETLIGSNAFLKLEYRYTNYKDWKVSYDDGDKETYGFDRHQAVVGLGVRF